MKIFGFRVRNVFMSLGMLTLNPDAEYPALSKSTTGSDRFLPNVFSSFFFLFFLSILSFFNNFWNQFAHYI